MDIIFESLRNKIFDVLLTNNKTRKIGFKEML